MSRGAFAGVAMAIATAVFAGCGALAGDVSESELESALAENEAGATNIDCEPGAQGWHYVCHFTDFTGKRMKLGMLVSNNEVTRTSAPIFDSDVLVEPRADGDQSHTRWITQVNALCQTATARMQAVTPPRTEAEFHDYVVAIRRLGREYLRDLGALPPAPRLKDRKIFAEILQLLEEDDRSVLALQEAVRTGDRQTIEWLFGVMGERNAKENALFNELGGQCVEA
jgi:hypothetical protein